MVGSGGVLLPKCETSARGRPARSASARDSLCAVGLPPSAADTVLHQAQLTSTATSALDASAVEEVCLTLVDVAGVPVASLHHVLAQAPELLAMGRTQLSERYRALQQAWLDERQLNAAICAHPAILTAAFSDGIKRCMVTLVDLGFSKRQTAAILLGAPEVVLLRRFEVLANLLQIGLDLAGADPTVFEFLSRRPQCITPSAASRSLKALLRRLKEWGLAAAQAQHVVAKCPRLLATPLEQVQEVYKALKQFGLLRKERAEVVEGWPHVLRLR